MNGTDSYTIEVSLQQLADIARAVAVDARIDDATVRDTPAGQAVAEILQDLVELHEIPLFRRFID